MPRQLRVQFAGAAHYAMSGGERREAIFLENPDRNDFLWIWADRDKLAVEAQWRKGTIATIKAIAELANFGTSKGANPKLDGWK